MQTATAAAPASKAESRPADTSVRIDGEQAAELARWVDKLNQGNDGPQWTRGEVLRRVLGHVLASKDAALLKPPPKPAASKP